MSKIFRRNWSWIDGLIREWRDCYYNQQLWASILPASWTARTSSQSALSRTPYGLAWLVNGGT
eukprot:2533717-Rhodomonas_salina.1